MAVRSSHVRLASAEDLDGMQTWDMS